jgi:hypothetical protein
MVSKFKRKGVIQMQTAMQRSNSLNVSKQKLNQLKTHHVKPTRQLIIPKYTQAELQEHLHMLMASISEDDQQEEIDFGIFGEEVL